ncbi:ABC transporter ATP-binding protein [Marinovum sp. 2_MG-2023]|uniref:ABC transporter ATP-binding protein n=1 Tax=Roseobacteraceae TaxID=2854170 RepID=UPI001FCFFD92|nr:MULTISPECIES: ABC transporter ATP-binding protein [Roseobacteraceae]MCJ7874118.1 ABC transporter ATP-binding protein [Phaeobacter sp. J2-8]MDO6732938.1 ABC transporter ATP-binding protein [Marinovum sp. 2_MG-2023]MDO6782216.1 ABC transporter ATP-binding protein [Marinovum sp. 1_MG-2023]
MTAPLLSVENLDMVFGGNKRDAGVRAVDDVSFDVMRGETFGIVGESGSGKTTLGRCIMRIIDPTAGKVTYRPDDSAPVTLTDLDKAELRKQWQSIRMIFQDPQSSLNPRLPVIELIGQALRKSEGLTGKALAERVAQLLQQVGLRPEFLHRYPGAFSGGQRQRIGIARALATGPKLVIADEAVSALDVSIQAQTLNLLQDLQDEFDLTYIFIAHDLAVVEHICDRVAVMYRGRIVELADRDTLFRTPAHPYTRELLEAVPVPDPSRRRDRKKTVPVPTGVQSAGCAFAPRCALATEICRNQTPPKRNVGGAEVLCHHVT